MCHSPVVVALASSCSFKPQLGDGNAVNTRRTALAMTLHKKVLSSHPKTLRTMPRLWILKSHWKTPTVILLAYLAALALAVGHHVFYNSLHGRDVDDYILDQEVTVAIGTAFAFLVRTTLVIAVGTVYWQMFWLRLGRQSFAVSEVDSLAGALTSIFDLTDVRALRSSPDLGIIALLAWLLPFAAVFPPATLTVRSTLREINERAHVPLPYLSGDAMATWSEFTLTDPQRPDYLDRVQVATEYEYSKPSLRLSRLAMATATRGSILDSQALYANSSYTISFEAPAVQCQEVTPEILNPFIKAAGCDCLSGKRPGDSEGQLDNLSNCLDLWYYISWVPSNDALVPFEANSIHNSSLPLEAAIANSRDWSASKSPFFGSFRDDAMSIYIATRDLGMSQTPGSWSVLSCSLHNATYFVNMTSDANRRNLPSLLKVSLLGKISNSTSSSELEINANLPASEKALFNYMAIMESMGPIFLGTIFEEGSAPFMKGFPYPQTSDRHMVVQPAYLMQSMLPFTTQLLPMLSQRFTTEDPGSQWSVIDKILREELGWNFTIVVPAFATDASTFNRPLGPAIEQLFHNLSMSFFSEPAFVKDSDEEVTITVRRPRNTYSYRYANFLLSYGLALGLSLLACIVGWVSIINNNASYSNRFSTVLRALSGGSVTSLVAPEDYKDPLPGYLAKARIDLSQGMSVQEGDRESEVELHEIFEQQSETASGQGMVQGLEEDTADSQRRLIRPDELSRRTSSEDPRDGSEAQVHQFPEAHHRTERFS
jgi:hypothetical protein